MWQAIRENPKAVTYAVLMHLLLLVLLMVGLDWTPKAIKPGVKTPIDAELVSSDKLQAIQQKKLAEQHQREEAEKQKIAEERRRKVDEIAQQKAAVEEKLKAEQAAAEKKKQADIATKKKQADLAAKKKQADIAAKKRAAAEAARRQEAEQALQAQLAEEESRARAESALAEYIPYIQEKIQRNWLRPVGSPPGLTCLVKVRLIPGGDVASVNVMRSSGDPVFDRSVETAVLKASPLPLPEDTALFKHFREINFNFDPGR